MHLTEGGKRIARSFGRGRSAADAVGTASPRSAAVGTLSGVLGRRARLGPVGPLLASGCAGYAGGLGRAPFGLPAVRPSTGAAAGRAGLADGASSARLLAGPQSASLVRPQPTGRPAAPHGAGGPAHRGAVLARRRACAADGGPDTRAWWRPSGSRRYGCPSTGPPPRCSASIPRSSASSPRGRPARRTRSGEGVAGGGIAVSYTMGTEDKIPLGGTGHRGRADARRSCRGGGVRHARHRRGERRGLRRDRPRAGALAANAIVVSVRPVRLHRRRAAAGRLIPKGQAVDPRSGAWQGRQGEGIFRASNFVRPPICSIVAP